jgi:hypothetical protein
MGRIVRTESGATRRNRILRGMGQALRAVGGQADVSAAESREVLAFLALCLAELSQSVEETAVAWERREYWLKADRFRAEWAWAAAILGRLEPALRSRDWSEAGACGMEIATALAERRLRVGDAKSHPWRGAWDAWSEKR